MKHPRRIALVAGILVVLLGAGAGIAFGLNDALGISSEASNVPSEHPVAAPAQPVVAPPVLSSVTAPQSERMGVAIDELRSSIAAAPTREGSAAVTVSYGTAADEDDSYRLAGTASDLHVVGAGLAGAVRGVYDLAAAARDGRPLSGPLNSTVSSRLPFRMVDIGAVGVTPDASEWASTTDYSQSSKAFRDVILDHAPYVDQAALAVARDDFETYVRHVVAEGYNAIAIPGFIEYLTFDSVGDGHAVYPAGDSHIAQALALRQAFAPIWQYAHDLGMKVYFRTDMLALTTPLEHYLTSRFGSLDTSNPALWSVYSAGLDELYRSMPFVDGVLIRVGEAGPIYDTPGLDYYSALAVTSVSSVRAMLKAFTAEGDRTDHDVIFRTWSVGVGGAGDMHTSDASYRKVLGGIDSPHLVVSTKYTLGDFYSHLPLNTTLEVGDQRRIVEFESKREFEGNGALPDDLGVLYQKALKRFIAANPHVEGIWTWTQDGGPWRAGPMSLELKAGFWQLPELNTELAVRLARDPDQDPAEITTDWARRWFSDDPATVRAIGQAMAQSRTAITDGLYIGPYADRRVFAIGLEPPPMMWIFEWNIPTGDSAALDVIYSVSKDKLDAAIAEGDTAVASAERMRAQIASTPAATWRTPAMRSEFIGTLDYEVDLLKVLGAYRRMVLHQAEWHDTGSDVAYRQWESAKDTFQSLAAQHEKRYAGDAALPAYNLTAAELGVTRAERDLPMAWVARAMLLLTVVWLAVGSLAARRRWAFGRLIAADSARALLIAGTRPWRAHDAVGRLSRAGRVVLVGVPAVVLAVSRGVYTWFDSPAHLILTLGSWLLLAAVLGAVLRKRSPWPVIAAAGGAVLLRSIVLLAALSVTGPGGYWFAFWTDPVRRGLYVTVAFTLFAWVLIAAGWALAGQIGRRRAFGGMVLTVGAVLGVMGLVVALIGLENAVTIWNDQMGLLPWGLSRILGITVYLGIPAESAWAVAIVGGVLVVVGAALLVPRRRPRTAVPQHPATAVAAAPLP